MSALAQVIIMLVNTEVFCREKVADQGDYFLLTLSNLDKTCSAASLKEKLPCEPGRNIQSLLLSRKNVAVKENSAVLVSALLEELKYIGLKWLISLWS